MACEFPKFTPLTAYGYGCRCKRCKHASMVQRRAFYAERYARAAANRKKTLERGKRERPDCKFQHLAAITAYNHGCRCVGCVHEKRRITRTSARICYRRNPAKYIAKTRAYNQRKRNESSSGHTATAA